MLERPDFMPFAQTDITDSQALRAGIYLVELFEELGRQPHFSEIETILCSDPQHARTVTRRVAYTTSLVAGTPTKKQYQNLSQHLRKRGEELNLL